MADQQEYINTVHKVINQPDAELTTADIEGAFGFVDVARAYEYLTEQGMILYGIHDVQPGVTAHALGVVSPYVAIPSDPLDKEAFFEELREGRHLP